MAEGAWSPHSLTVALGARLRYLFLICIKTPCGPAAALPILALVSMGAAVSHRQGGQTNPGESQARGADVLCHKVLIFIE